MSNIATKELTIITRENFEQRNIEHEVEIKVNDDLSILLTSSVGHHKGGQYAVSTSRATLQDGIVRTALIGDSFDSYYAINGTRYSKKNLAEYGTLVHEFLEENLDFLVEWAKDIKTY